MNINNSINKSIDINGIQVSNTNLKVIKDTIKTSGNPVTPTFNNKDSNIGLDSLANPQKKRNETQSVVASQVAKPYVNDAIAESEIDQDDILNMIEK